MSCNVVSRFAVTAVGGDASTIDKDDSGVFNGQYPASTEGAGVGDGTTPQFGSPPPPPPPPADEYTASDGRPVSCSAPLGSLDTKRFTSYMVTVWTPPVVSTCKSNTCLQQHWCTSVNPSAST